MVPGMTECACDWQPLIETGAILGGFLGFIILLRLI